MKVILLQDVKSLGKRGDVKDVAEGYARNFLFPKKMAEVATPEAVKSVEVRKAQEKAETEAHLEEMRKIAGALKEKTIVLKSKEKNGKLFGSITARDILHELKKENLEVEEKNIILKNPIKKIGAYEVEIELAEKIGTKIRLEVQGEK
jgi:large subunit ribosomal protein L9